MAVPVHAAPLTVAVNLSSRQLEPGDLTTVVREGLERTGLDAACLQLELTETAIIDLRPNVLQQLEASGISEFRSASTTSAPGTPRLPTSAVCP